MARCGCGGACACNLTAGSNVVITGSGASGNPWVVNSHVNCTEARACFSSGSGTTYDQVNGKYNVCVSPNAGNQLTQDGNGCLFVPASTANVTAGCGLTGNGSGASPLTIRGKAWPFSCTQSSSLGTGVYCDPATGLLHADPPFRGARFVDTQTTTIALPGTPVPTGPSVAIQTVSMTITNPDPCRFARVETTWEVDIDLDLPPGSGGAYGMDGDDLVYLANEGSATVFATHAQETRIVNSVLTAGQTAPVTMQIFAGRGSGGAVMRRIQWIGHVNITTVT